jgi:hypothetical protein
VALLAVAIMARAGDLAPFHAYPALTASGGGSLWGVAVALVGCALLPFADRRGIVR